MSSPNKRKASNGAMGPQDFDLDINENKHASKRLKLAATASTEGSSSSSSSSSSSISPLAVLHQLQQESRDQLTSHLLHFTTTERKESKEGKSRLDPRQVSVHVQARSKLESDVLSSSEVCVYKKRLSKGEIQMRICMYALGHLVHRASPAARFNASPSAHE